MDEFTDPSGVTPKQSLIYSADSAERAASRANERLGEAQKECARLTERVAEMMRISREYREAAAKL